MKRKTTFYFRNLKTVIHVLVFQDVNLIIIKPFHGPHGSSREIVGLRSLWKKSTEFKVTISIFIGRRTLRLILHEFAYMYLY